MCENDSSCLISTISHTFHNLSLMNLEILSFWNMAMIMFSYIVVQEMKSYTLHQLEELLPNT